MEPHLSMNLFKKFFTVTDLMYVSNWHSTGYICRFFIAIFYILTNPLYILMIMLGFRFEFSGMAITTTMLILGSMVIPIKFGSLVFNIGSFTRLNTVLGRMDSEIKDHEEQNMLAKRVAVALSIFWIYAGNVFFGWATGLITALISHKERLIISGLLPYDWRASTRKYYMTLCYQSIGQVVLLVEDGLSDLFRIFYVYIVAGHLNILGQRIARIGYTEPENYQGNYEELVKAIRKHQAIIRIVDELNRIISKVFFIELLVMQITICLGFFYIFVYDESFLNKSCFTFYIVSLVMTTGLQCYFGSELIGQSEKFAQAIYACNWTEQDPKFKKLLLILMMRSQKHFEITAGGIISVSLPTALNVFKTSYSMFALIRQLYG